MGKLACGLVHQAIQGERLCGDQYCVLDRASYVLVAVADGLGHGERAHQAAREAIAYVEAHAERPVQTILEGCHGAISGTRGVVLALARIDREARTLTHAGLGNIETRIITAEKVRHPLTVQGILGHSARKFRHETFPFAPGDMLIMHSDGISDRFDATPAMRHREPQMLALQLAHEFGRPNDDQLLLVLKEEPAAP